VRSRTRYLPRLVAAGVALAALAAAAGACLAWRELGRPYSGWSGPHVDVELDAGLSAGEMLERLGQAGVVRRPALLRRWVEICGGAGSLHAGEYRFDEPISPLGVLARLESGAVLLHPVTVPEGLGNAEIASRFVEAGFGTAEGLLAAFADPAPVRDLDPGADSLEGYLFPETYRFARGAEPRSIAGALVERFRESVGPTYARRAESVGLTLRQAVTLASLIERETSVPGERGRISRVFHNRLARGMRLQCDPTVLYALHRAGRRVRALSYRDLEFDSPWNTYRVTGLPPGPIANPGLASLEAAVAPAAGDDLYFVAAPGGGHRFSSTLEQHLQAVAAWRTYSRSSR
jgi:UPF0755 protein